MRTGLSIRAWRHLLWPLGAVSLVVFLDQVGRASTTTYGGSSRVLLWIEVITTCALIVVGTVMAGTARIGAGPALALLGLLWLSAEWAGLMDLQDGARTFTHALSVAVLPAAAVATLFVLLPAGRSRRVLAAATLSAGVAATVSTVTLTSPFFDLRCWRICAPSPTAIAASAELSRWVVRISTFLLSGVALAVLGYCVSAAIDRRRPLSATVAVALLCGLTTAAVLRLQFVESNQSAPFQIAFVAAQVGALGLAVIAGAEQWRAWRLRISLTRLVENLRLTSSPATLAGALRSALHDDELDLAYRASGRSDWVDGTGRPVGRPLGEGRTSTTVVRGDGAVASIRHADGIKAEHLDAALGPALRMSIENARLQAATLAELAELKDARVRLVQQSDSERRRLERNLHDGAQQRVVGLTLHLQLLRLATDATADASLIEVVQRAQHVARQMLTELRRIALGIHPAMVLDAGLTEALRNLAESFTTVAVGFRTEELAGQLADVVQIAAYLTAETAVRDSVRRGATEATLSLQRCGGMLTLTLLDDGDPPDDRLRPQLDDRIGALGGRIDIGDRPVRGARIRLELPCGS